MTSNVASLRLWFGEERALTLRAIVHLATAFVALTSSGSRCVVGVAATATPSKTFASISNMAIASNTFSIIDIAIAGERFTTTVAVPSYNFTIATISIVSTSFTRAVVPLHRVIRCSLSATLTAVARGALVMVAAATKAGGGGIVRAVVDAAGGAPPMFIDSTDA